MSSKVKSKRIDEKGKHRQPPTTPSNIETPTPGQRKKEKKGDKDENKNNSKDYEAVMTPAQDDIQGDTSSEDDESSDENRLENEMDLKEPWMEFWTKEELRGRYLPTKELGRGSYGVVYEGKSTWDNKKLGITKGLKVAIKKVRRVFQTSTDTKRLLRELKILHKLRGHPSIVTLYDILPPTDAQNYKTLTLVFEFVDADLSKIFKTNQFFSELHVQYMLYHLILGVNYMHTAGVVHRDLKPANVLINSDCSIKVCDFGLSRGFSEKDALTTQKDINNKKYRSLQKGLTTHVVTRWYRAPEVILLQQKRSNLMAVDVWSIGCIFGELAQMMQTNCPTVWKRGPLFPGDSCFPLSPKRSKKKNNSVYQSHYDQIRVIFDVLGTPSQNEINKLDDEQARQYLEDLPSIEGRKFCEMFPGLSEDGINIMKGMLRFNVEDRLTINQLLQHEYFSRVKEPHLEIPFQDDDLLSASSSNSDEDKNINKENKENKKNKEFAFEDYELSRKEYGSLILHHVCKYHPECAKKFKDSGCMFKIKSKKKKSDK